VILRIGRRELALPDLPPWAGRVGKVAGYPLYGLLIFLFVLYLSLPWSRAKDRLEAEASAAGYDVQIGSLGPAFLFGFRAQDVVVKTRPVMPGEKPTRIVLDRVTVHPSLLGLLFKHVSFDYRVRGFGGVMSGSYSQGADAETDLEARDIDLTQVPGIEYAFKLPMGGSARGAGALFMPKTRFGEAKGELKFDCKDCSIGDGKAKLPLPGNQFFAEGVTVPRIKLGNLSGKVVVDKGVARLVAVESHSPDMDVKIEGDVTLRDPIGFSSANFCLAFKPSAALSKREAVFGVLGQSLDQTAKRADGYYTLRVSGRLDSMYFMTVRCGAGAGGTGPNAGPGAPPMMRPGSPATTFTPPASTLMPPAPPGATVDLPPPPPTPNPSAPDAAAVAAPPPQPPPTPPLEGTAPPLHVGAPVRGTVLSPTPTEPQPPPAPPAGTDKPATEPSE